MCVEHAHAGNKLISAVARPFPVVLFHPDLVLDRHDRLVRSCAGDDVAKNLFGSSGAARALENPDIPSLSRRVIAINEGEFGCELECLVFRERVHTVDDIAIRLLPQLNLGQI